LRGGIWRCSGATIFEDSEEFEKNSSNCEEDRVKKWIFEFDVRLAKRYQNFDCQGKIDLTGSGAEYFARNIRDSARHRPAIQIAQRLF
jgi:hypothetical protein